LLLAVQMLFFCSTNDIFLVCSTNFLVWGKKIEPNFCREFAAFWCKFLLPYWASFAALRGEFCRLMAQFLPPYDACFAALC